MRTYLLPLCLILVGCMPGPVPDQATRAAPPETTSALPAIKTFSTPEPTRPQRSNIDIAQDFLDLSFRLESGRDLPVLTRFTQPISIRVTGVVPPTLMTDLRRLIHRFRHEAGLQVALTDGPTASITIQAITRAQIRKNLPQAACFVVPNITNISQYPAARHSPKANWGLLRKRTQMAVFVPSDAAPQEVRDCLHEELAQAIGPLNDLYRLPDSVFNDDNIHTVLTGFDMLMLKTYYAPELHNGMTRAEVARRLPAILARLNPAGQHVPAVHPGPTPRSWIDAVQTALGPGSGPTRRIAAARRAVSIAKSLGWQDHRRAFAHYSLGRLLVATDPQAAYAQFKAADHFYAMVPNTSLHRAYVASQLAAHALSRGDAKTAISVANRAIPAASRSENAALLATLLLLRAEALELSGHPSEAAHVRLDSLGWARYGFGADWAVRAKLREISALNPLKGKRG
jgi:hypothetical protein